MTSIAEPLREYYKKILKIGMAPWVKTCTMDMKDAYTELVMEKVENGTKFVGIKDYRVLFKDAVQQQQWVRKRKQPSKIPIRNQKGSKTRPLPKRTKASSMQRQKSDPKNRNKQGKRILVKADPGMGKTTLSRKIAWDWAMGILNDFTIVFLVTVKLIKPGQSIEDAIIAQTPPLRGIGITPKILKRFLNEYGGNCLLILDGYDEHSLGKNNKIDEIIETKNLFRCNVIVTSRPHVAASIEPALVVVRLLGFSKVNAHSFTENLLPNKEQQQKAAVKFARGYSIAHICPMILLFTCILMKDAELENGISILDIFFRLLRCVFRKYVERVGKMFDPASFAASLRKFGRLALKTLLSGNYSYQKSEIEGDLGEHAFEIGFISGHEDYRLESDETADIVLSFTHTSIEEFLGALGFLQRLDDGENIEDILRNQSQGSLFLARPLFLHFCLYFLESDQSDFQLTKVQNIKESLKMYFVKRTDVAQLDFCQIGLFYPALEIGMEGRDKIVTAFLKDVLSNCKRVRYLTIGNYDPVTIFDFMKNVLSQVHVLRITNDTQWQIGGFLTQTYSTYNRKRTYSSDHLNIDIMSPDPRGIVRTLRPLIKNIGKSVALYLTNFSKRSELDLSKLLSSGVAKIFVVDHWHLFTFISKPLKKVCPSLAQIHIEEANLDESVVHNLSLDMKIGKLPSLSHLTIISCRSALKGKLLLLFDSPWRELTHLDLDGCALDKVDIKLLRSHADLFPKLFSLTFSASANRSLHETVNLNPGRDESLVALSKDTCWPNLHTLQISEVHSHEFNVLKEVISCKMFPQLRELNISMCVCKTTATEQIPKFDLSSLTHFALHWFHFPRQSIKRVIPIQNFNELYSFDISHSQNVKGILTHLLSQIFSNLHTLILNDCEINKDDLKRMAHSSVKDSLPALKHLNLSYNEQIRGKCKHLFTSGAKWDNLEVISLEFDKQLSDKDFQAVELAVDSGALSSLRELYISVSEAKFLLPPRNQCWQISLLHLECCSSRSYSVLTNVINAVKNDVFPELTTVCFSIKKRPPEPQMLEDVKSLIRRLASKLPGGQVFCIVKQYLGFLSSFVGSEPTPGDADDIQRIDYIFAQLMRRIVEALTISSSTQEKAYILDACADFTKTVVIPKYGPRIIWTFFEAGNFLRSQQLLQERNIVVDYSLD